ncbi:MAG: hypothetical protein LBP22_04105 [Deltaproteobacteria bacterium]|jgi:hypothetical protein|nr:hypothetical protein [Deltaproteobacteria bacterium]
MNWSSSPPLILDFDGSVRKLSDDETRIDLKSRQEEIRFGCSWSAFKRFEQESPLPPDPGCLFLGSGDYHHLSLMPIKKLAASQGPLEVVVCDNHPDNMRYPFGVHCGSWVSRATALPGVGHVHVIGITSSDVAWPHAWENYWLPLISGRLTYWCVGQKAAWLNLLRRGQSCRSFETADELMDSFCVEAGRFRRVYLSIDKDVFGPETVKTNWDQGVWDKRHLEALIMALSGRLAGADVTGEVSAYEYRGWFKRFLIRLDGLEMPDPRKLEIWQAEQRKINLEILALLKKAGH